MIEVKLASMTGFARTTASIGDLGELTWEMRSFNGRGLDIRLRLPPGLDRLEAGLRAEAAKLLIRGNISATLTIKGDGTVRPVIDRAMLDAVLAAALDLARRIPNAPAPRAELLLALPGVLRNAEIENDPVAQAVLDNAIIAGFVQAVHSLHAARIEEGSRLGSLLLGFLDEAAALAGRGRELAALQSPEHYRRLVTQLSELLSDVGAFPSERMAHEVALLATKSDVREELDRLDAHIDAARVVLRDGGAIGRRLDFLMQELNREANTLCSKAASLELTEVGLELKALIEQLREQAQNVE